jgi:uncharacterized protein YcbK (DUF882 family)
MLPRCNPRRHTFYDLKARSLVRVGGGAKAGTAVSAVLTARRVSLATLLLIAGSFGLQQALAAPGDTRTLWLHHIHTKEEVQITFKRNGQFDEEGLKKVNWALRDWRTDAPIKMDPEVIDLLWEVYRDTGAKQPIHIIGGYRSPATNSMLRSRSKGVAKHSQHTLGKAIDFFIPGVPLDVLRAAAMKAQGGGVGYYPTSGSPFVHLDVGSVRAWPRMTRDQLAKLFPDGRTVHLPPDGNPLPGYQLALADLERGQRTAPTPQKRSLLASLFNRDKDAEEADDTTSAREIATAQRALRQRPAPAAPARTVVAAVQTPAPTAPAPAVQAPAPVVAEAPVPLPPRRPMYQVASAESRPAPAPAPRPAQPINLASLSPSDIINMRGLWDGFQEAASEDSLNLSSARRALASSLTAAAGRDVTATIGQSGADRVPSQIALAYASPAPANTASGRGPAVVPAVVTSKDGASIAQKPVDNLARSRMARTDDKFDDPWMRGLMLTPSLQNSLIVTRVGDIDVTSLSQHMQKPASAVMMTFTADPNLGANTDSFSGSAVVFPAIVTFSPTSRRTAALR